MFFMYTFVGDKAIVYVPTSTMWRLQYFEFDDDHGYHSLYLFVESEPYQLRWRESLDCEVFTETEISSIYKAIIERVWELVADGINFIDIDRIESDILQDQYPEVQ